MKSVIEIYSDMAKNNPPWSAKEQAEAIKKWFRKDRERFINEAMKHNLSLVFHLVERYAFNKTEDVVQKAVIAMVEALKKYNPKKGKISTWLVNPIRWVIHKMQDSYSHEGSISDEISALSHRYNRKMRLVSTDSPIGNDEGSNDTVGTLISNKDLTLDYFRARGFKTAADEAREIDIKEGVDALMNKMPKFLTKQELVVVKGLLKGRTMSDISVELKLSRMRISQISGRAFEKIRRSSLAVKLKPLVK